MSPTRLYRSTSRRPSRRPASAWSTTSSPSCRKRSSDAFFNFPWEGTSLQEEFEKSNEGQFLPMTYKEFWEVIRKIDAANGVSYACE
jgi:hypothetical protein